MSSFDIGPGRRFNPHDLQSSVIAIPLLRQMGEPDREFHRVLIEVHRDYPGAEQAENRVRAMLRDIIGADPNQGIVDRGINHYVVAQLTAASIRELVRRDRESAPRVAVYHVWPDFDVEPLINRSAATVKADAAQISFAALGHDIVWAVVDSGIDAKHRHFYAHHNLEHDDRHLRHMDFTIGGSSARVDEFGHGTHVAGIIAGDSAGFGPKQAAGAARSVQTNDRRPVAIREFRDENDNTTFITEHVDTPLLGMAPQCGLVSYKVLDAAGRGASASIIAALQHIQKVNSHGDNLRIHGVNLSLGYSFDPTWFACGQSPICVEVDRLVRSGVVVVVAAGNTGNNYNTSQGQTINDPGNADLAITVGSTHRDMPHTYGVSYFSSKGPTGDGRAKPDLLAPGERILSCATGATRDKILGQPQVPAHIDYIEDSGTSMSASHVSGVIAAFLSVRKEFIGKPEEIKRIFTSTATDLGRVRAFQGHGLIDLMRAIQSV